MEVSSRDSIKDCVRDRKDGPPEMTTTSEHFKKAITEYLMEDYSHLSKMARVQLIYILADDYMNESEDISVCRKGCAWCCKIPVEIMPIEAEYIGHHTGHKPSKRLTKKPGPPGYCPLLDKKTGQCTVYYYRPFNCRTFITYDSPDYCRDRVEHWTSGGPHNSYGSEALLALAMSLVEIEIGKPIGPTTKLILNGRIKDIRQVFR